MSGRRAHRPAGTAWLLRRWLRHRWTAAVPIVTIVGVGMIATLTLFDVAQRTATAYEDFLERTDAGDVQLNMGLDTRQIDELIRSLPDVEQVTSRVFFQTSADDGTPRSREALLMQASGSPLDLALVFGSSDGRHVDMDRPLVRAGEMPDGPGEIALNADLSAALGASIGDTIELAFWPIMLDDPDQVGLDPAAYYSEIVEPLGVESLVVTGTVVFADELLPDELYPKLRGLVSPDVAARYECRIEEPSPGSSWQVAVRQLAMPACAGGYRYHSLRISGGCSACLLETLTTRLAARNRDLADIADLVALNRDRAASGLPPLVAPSYRLIPTETEFEVSRVAQATRPVVTGLVVLGAAVAVVAAMLTTLAAARLRRLTASDRRRWHELGVDGRTAGVVVSGGVIAAIAAGLSIGTLVAIALPRRAVGVVDVVAGPPRSAFGTWATMAALALAIVVVTGGVAVAVASSAGGGPSGEPVRRSQRRGRRAVPLPPALADGVRSATVGRAVLPTIVGATVLVGAVSASAVVASALTSLTDTPRSFGWPYDLAAIYNVGYPLGLDTPAALAALRDDPAVATTTVLGFLNDVSLGADPVMTVVVVDADDASTGGTALTMLSGRLPVGVDEVALGATTAARHGVDIGDQVELLPSTGFLLADAPTRVTVTGLAVLPALGPFEANRVGAGTGVVLPVATLGESAPFYASFIGLTLAPGSDASTVDRIVELLRSFGDPDTQVYVSAVRPSQLVDAGGVRAVPTIVASVFGFGAALALGATAWASTRGRRREIAVLRTIGFDSRQVVTSVLAAAATVAAVAVVIGVPLGVIVGRLAWRAFADELGVVPDVPDLALVAASVALAVLSVGLAVALPAARRATISSPSTDLPAE